MRNIIIACFILIIGAGCISYYNTPKGEFKGSLDIRWVENDYFLFLPNKNDPLIFERANGEKIQPKAFCTDGGSIPQFLWGLKNLSPWGYAPAYIIHDWMFRTNRCKYETYTFKNSVSVMEESLKTLMEENKKTRSYFVFKSITAAISSDIAKNLWKNGDCKALQ